MKLSRARRDDLLMVVLGLFVILLDQLTKHWIVAYFGVPNGRPPIALVGPYLEIIYLRNRGVAFSLLSGQSVMFLFIAIAIVVIGFLYWRMRDTGSLLIKATFGMILGGAVGNLIDRFAHTYVVDFVHFQIPGAFDFAVFNVADSAISVGVVVLAYLLWRASPQEAASGTPTPRDGAAPATPAALDPSTRDTSPRVRHLNTRAR